MEKKMKPLRERKQLRYCKTGPYTIFFDEDVRECVEQLKKSICGYYEKYNKCDCSVCFQIDEWVGV